MPFLAKALRAEKPVAKKEPLWAGPCGAGPHGGITQSMLGRYLVCKERFRVRFVLGLEPPRHFDKKIFYGDAWHVCEEAHAANKPFQPALETFCAAAAKTYPYNVADVLHWGSTCSTQFPVYAKHWANHADVINRKPLMQESVFDVPFKLASGRTVRLRGKFDSVDLITDNAGPGVWLQENKTKGDVDESRMKRQLTFDLQTMLYLTALTSFRGLWDRVIPVLGVRYNVIRRPFAGGKGNIKKHEAKCTKETRSKRDGRILKPSKITPAETDEQFYGRLRRDYLEKEPGYWFMRWQVRIGAGDLARFKREFLEPVLENLCDDYEWWAGCESKVGQMFTNVWDMERRRKAFPEHAPRHFRYPFGTYNPLTDGSGQTDYDEFLLTGGTAGLRRATELFGELKC